MTMITLEVGAAVRCEQCGILPTQGTQSCSLCNTILCALCWVGAPSPTHTAGERIYYCKPCDPRPPRRVSYNRQYPHRIR